MAQNDAAKTAAGKDVGQIGAQQYMFRGHPAANKVYHDTSPNGNGTFDFVYKEGDQFIVVEAKGLGGRRRTRNAGTSTAPDYVQQGNGRYLDDVIDNMIASGGEKATIARQLKAARQNGKLTYMEVATKKDGAKKWFTVSEFRLS